MASEKEIKEVQRLLNDFSKRFRLGFTPVIVDGDKGHATRKRIREAKYLLGFKRDKTDAAEITDEFVRQLRHPRHPLGDDFGKKRVKRGKRRRRHLRKQNRRNRYKAVRSSGVTTWGGKPVAKWFVPYLNYARDHGWKGGVTSGWRDPAYSEGLCYRMCGRPSCLGRCAGRSSNHVGSSFGTGALDVSDYAKFGQLMKSAPFDKKIFNALGAQDPVHFSASGR